MLSSLRDLAPVTRHFFAPSLDILYAADFNYLIRWVIVTYIGDFTVTSFAVSRGHPAPLVGKRLLAGGLRVYFCLYSCLVYINFAHTQDHDYVLYLCGGTSGVVWTACFSLLSSKKMENEENSG